MSRISRALSFLHSHPSLAWAALIVYAAAVTLPHEQVQWQCSMLALKITHEGVYRISAAIGLVEVVIFTLFLLLSVRRKPQGRLVAGLWLLTLALTFCAWRAFTANNLELVHYPQYFPEGLLLTALTLSPADALSWVVLFACLDEGYQFWLLSKGLPTVFDFNDIFMDLLGGAAGVVFALAFLRCLPGIKVFAKRTGVILVLSLTAVGTLLWASGRMLLVEDKTNPHYWFALGRFRAPSFWFQIVTNGPYKYHTLTPVEGVVLIFATIALYTILLRKYGIACAT